MGNFAYTFVKAHIGQLNKKLAWVTSGPSMKRATDSFELAHIVNKLLC